MSVLAKRMAQLYPDLYPQRFSMKVVPIIDGVVGPFRKKPLHDGRSRRALVADRLCERREHAAEPRRRARKGDGHPRLARRESDASGETTVDRERDARPARRRARNAVRTGRHQATRPAIPTGLIPREALIQLDGRVLAFSLGLALLTALVFGLAPALSTVRRDLVNPLRDSGKGTSGGFRRGRLSSALVVIEVALSLVLLDERRALNAILHQAADGGAGPRSANGSCSCEFPSRASGTKRRRPRRHSCARPWRGSARCPASWPQRPQRDCRLRRRLAEFDVPGTTHDDTWRAIFHLGSARLFQDARDPAVTGPRAERRGRPGLAAGRCRKSDVRATSSRRSESDRPHHHREEALSERGSSSKVSSRSWASSRTPRIRAFKSPPAPEVVVPYGVGRAFEPRDRGQDSRPAARGSRRDQARDLVGRSRGADRECRAVTTYLARYAYAAPRLGFAIFGTFAALGLVLVVLGRRRSRRVHHLSPDSRDRHPDRARRRARDHPSHDARHGDPLDRTGDSGGSCRELSRNARHHEPTVECEPYRSVDTQAPYLYWWLALGSSPATSPPYGRRVSIQLSC